MSVTLGAVFVGTSSVLAYALYWWFREGHRVAALVPFLLSTSYGILAILTTGGLLAVASGTLLWGSGGLGDLALVWGAGGATGDVTRASAHSVALTPGGVFVVALLTVALVCLVMWAPIPRWKLAAGILTGVCLGLSGTFAGLAAVPLASAANALGAPLTQVVG